MAAPKDIARTLPRQIAVASINRQPLGNRQLLARLTEPAGQLGRCRAHDLNCPMRSWSTRYKPFAEPYARKPKSGIII